MPNTSGIMPLEVDSGSGWEEKKEEYIQDIVNWIDNGAKDMFGNSPSINGLNPQVKGLIAFNSGETTNPLSRNGSTANKPISIKNTAIDVWFSFEDDKTAVKDLNVSKVEVSKSITDFSQATTHNVSNAGPITFKDFYKNNTDYTHKVTLNFPSDSIGTYLYLKVFVKDQDHVDPAEIPSLGASNLTKSYYTLKVDSL